MKEQEIFSSLSCEKTLEILKKHTSPDRKVMYNYVWKSPDHPRHEWACLVGEWEGDAFKGKVFRHYGDQSSGGIALPKVSLKAEPAGNLGKISLREKYSSLFRWMIVLFIAVAVLQVLQIVLLLPEVKPVPIIVLFGWIALCALVLAMIVSQYRHECAAIGEVIKQMTKAFDQAK